MPKTTNHKVEPIERFPAKPRPDGRFQKRIHGKLHYFGDGSGDRAAALREYERRKHALYSSLSPDAPPPEAFDPDAIGLAELVGLYVTHLRAEVKADRRSAGHLEQTERALARLQLKLGPERSVASLSVEDFAGYGRWLSKKLGHHAFNRERAIVGTLFNHAHDSGWIAREVRLGRGFRKHSRKAMRSVRQFKMVEPRQYVAMLAAAPTLEWEARLLLGGNCGYGHADFGALTWWHVDLDAAIIRHFHRTKTGIDRDSPLWPETVEVLRLLRAKRPDDDLVFRTKPGNPWSTDVGAHRFTVMLGRMNVDRKAAGLEPLGDIVFGDLRHTFATYASEACDSDAWRRVMGHALEGMKMVYVETIFEPRLRFLVEHVRKRMFA